MKAFHNDAAVKEKYLARVRAHRSADELVKGQYWQNGKGCAVGCTIHSSHHSNYETELGIPRRIAYIEDRLFERMPNENAMSWPERFLEAIPVGADLAQVVDRWLHWMLMDEKEGTIRFANTEKTREAMTRVGEMYARRLNGTDSTREEWWEAARLCREARSASWANYYAAADAAADAAAADAADAAAADAAAADAAAAAWRYSAKWNEVRNARVVRLSEKLLELLAAAPVKEEVAA